jgi:hypothetical protein
LLDVIIALIEGDIWVELAGSQEPALLAEYK